MFHTLIITDVADTRFEGLGLPVLTFDQYLSEYPKANEPKVRLINLCNTETYLSRGYYCSLLAEARNHKVLPSVGSINDLRGLTLHFDPNSDKGGAIKHDWPSEGGSFHAFFGRTEDPAYARLARKVYEQVPAPLLYVTLTPSDRGFLVDVKTVCYSSLSEELLSHFMSELREFTTRVWRRPSPQRKYRWELAILIDPDEAYPPSDKEAIKMFIKAASRLGIEATTITRFDADRLSQFDALFIRETTAIDHHTYRIARRAEREGLVTIDDSSSILRCCNKVYLHDAFTYNGVPSLKTRVAISSDEAELDRLESEFTYPMVLKMPEGSFSRGIYKVANREELKSRLQDVLTQTALILVQEYFYTDYDWRIGVLNGQPLYACRYHMARNHWQIYNHNSKKYNSGGFECMPTFEVPRKVLAAATKAATMIGTGLYGVDLKQAGEKVFVIEVNDNPNVDHNIEDQYLGSELYMQIMGEFVRRLEARGR